MVLTDVERVVSNVAVQAPLGLKIERTILLFTFALQNCFNKLQEKNDNTAIEEMWLTNNPRVEL